MGTFYVANRFPVMVEGYEKFKGPNPWASGAETLWYVGGFRWGANQKHTFIPPQPARSGGKQPRGIWAGIYAPEAKILRLLPKGLQELWWTGKLPAQDLPWFLHQLSPQDTVDTRPGTYINEIVIGGIVSFFWAMSAIVVVKTLVTEGTLRNFLQDWAGWACLAFSIFPPVIAALLHWSGKNDSRRLKERGLALLRDGTGNHSKAAV